MLVIQISRHCSEQILARQWEVKGKRAKLRKESFQLSLENCQGFSVPDGGGKFIPRARNGECSREWFCDFLWWHHEVTLAHRSQTSWGDVDCYKWVEVGGCCACGCSSVSLTWCELQPGASAVWEKEKLLENLTQDSDTLSTVLSIIIYILHLQ